MSAVDTSIDTAWKLICGIFVFLMQPGFALLEAGTVRSKNTQSVLMKNCIDCCYGACGWFVLGYGLAFGTDNVSATHGGGFNGTDMFFVTNKKLLPADASASIPFSDWFWQFTFCATAATIVSGSLAERCELKSYCIFSFFMCLFIYPIVVHWTWGGGFLANEGFIDFAGSGVVHYTGGCAAFVGAAILGPRTGRFDGVEMPPSNVLHVCIGTFFLWASWYAFNGGSTCAMAGDNAVTAGRCMVTTTLAAAAGGLTAFNVDFFTSGEGKFNICQFANGVLGGLVSITAGCSNMNTTTAFLTGVIGGIVMIGWCKVLELLKVDDPLSASAVHGACGVWGLIAAGLFDMDMGLFYGGAFGDGLWPNIYGWIMITLWVAGFSGLIFMGLRMAGILRVTIENEEEGLDSEFTYFDNAGDVKPPTKVNTMITAPES